MYTRSQYYYQCWLPEGEPKAVILIVHGLAEHCGRYTNVFNHFVPLGYAVYGVDHLGHGKSDGDRVYVERFEDYTDTLKIFFDQLEKWQPGKPVFLFGHSLGGLIGVVYLLDHQNELTGTIISAPLLKMPGNISPAVVFMGKVLSRLLPKFGLVGVDAEGVSSDPAVVQAYVNDPLVYRGKTTARLGGELMSAMQRVQEQASTLELPMIILQGSADKLVDPTGAQMLYDSARSADKTLKIYEGFYHEVFNEPGRDQVLYDVEVWLNAHAN